MGKRKSKKKVITKKRPSLASKFKCPFCCTEASCEVKFDKADAMATIQCRVCSESFMTRVTTLTEPIDVYTDWLDECEASNALDDVDGMMGGGGGAAAAAALESEDAAGIESH